MSLSGRVCVVTGASRGIGRGIAVQLGEAGAKVYVTGRQPAHSDNKDATPALRTLDATAKEITSRGGEGIGVYCDHSDPGQVEALFKRVAAENGGRLDVLVNNAYAAVKALTDNWGAKFWETEPLFWDVVNDVGLRNHYVCSVHAARLMVPRGQGLIVNVSSAGGLQYIFNVAYGVGKAALDRLSADMAVELRPHNVAVVSLWPGAVQTEMFGGIMGAMAEEAKPANALSPMTSADMAKAVAEGETVEYAGKAVAALAGDPKGALGRSGRVALATDLGDVYGFTDEGGRKPPSMRSLKTALQYSGWKTLASFVPAFLKVPGLFLAAGTHHF